VLHFATLFHEYPAAARDLVRGVRYHYPEATYHYGVDHPGGLVGTSFLELRMALRERRRPAMRPIARDSFLEPLGAHLIPRQRDYSWHNLHRFLFDVLESLRPASLKHLVIADSDSFFAGPGLRALLVGDWDFTVTCSGSAYEKWDHSRAFADSWDLYCRIGRRLGLRPSPARLGTMFGLFVISRRAADTLREMIPTLEADEDFRAFEAGDPGFPFYEALIPQLLSDAGMTPRPLAVEETPGYRNRPQWSLAEWDDAFWFYHPISRLPADPCRRILRARLDKV